MLTQLNNGHCQPEKHHVSEWMHDDFGTMQYFYMLTKGNATLLRKVEHSAKAVVYSTLIKKENQIFLIYEEIQSGAVAKSYMRKGFLIYVELRKHFPIYGEALVHSEFPYV